MRRQERVELMAPRQAGAAAQAGAFHGCRGAGKARALRRRLPLDQGQGIGAMEGIAGAGGVDHIDHESRLLPGLSLIHI